MTSAQANSAPARAAITTDATVRTAATLASIQRTGIHDERTPQRHHRVTLQASPPVRKVPGVE
jgi:hypothetical protein